MAGADPLGEDALRQAALAYLARYAATTRHLERVLLRRLRRHADALEAEPGGGAEVRARVSRVVARLAEAGLVDDAGYAAMKAERLLRQGASSPRIRAVLRDKGVPDDLGTEADAALDRAYGPERERLAALRHARRRGFGPWTRSQGRPEAQAKRRERQVAALVRAGFPPPLAAWAVDCPRDEAEALLAEARLS